MFKICKYVNVSFVDVRYILSGDRHWWPAEGPRRIKSCFEKWGGRGDVMYFLNGAQLTLSRLYVGDGLGALLVLSNLGWKKKVWPEAEISACF